MSKRRRLERNNICGKWIRFVRKGFYGKSHPKMSQEKLASKLRESGINIDRSALSRIESGSRILSDIEVAYFAYALNVPIDFLYFGTDERIPQIPESPSIVADCT